MTKPEKVTRAVAVYEWTGDLNNPTASRLVPVSLFIDGHLEDAGVYLARPVPFALNAGYVYSVEKAGEPVGTLDLDEARNLVTRRSQDDDNPLSAWFGYGRYIPPPAAAKAPALHTAAHPGVIVSTSGGSTPGRPHLSDRSGNEDNARKDKPPSENPSGAHDKSTTGSPAEAAPSPDSEDPDRPHMSHRSDTRPETPGSSPPPSSSSPDDPDRPHMSRRSESSTNTDTEPAPAPTSSTPGAASDDDAERPTLRRRDARADSKKRKESGSGVTPMATSLNDDPDRPSLRRGSEATPAGTPPLSGNPPDLRQAVAVSDAATMDTHPFARGWESATERAATLAAFQALAKPRVANYLALNKLTAGVPGEASRQPPGATPAAIQEDTGAPPKLQRGRPGESQVTAPPTPTAAPSRPAPKTPVRTAGQRALSKPTPAPLLLTEEQLAGFTLSYGGLPTFVYSAQTPVRDGVPVHITLVAQQLPSGELQVALSSLTDEAHLDRTPWMRLIDVVDPTDSHRASMLFELRAKTSRQFALYSLASAHAEQTFTTGLMQ